MLLTPTVCESVGHRAFMGIWQMQKKQKNECLRSAHTQKIWTLFLKEIKVFPSQDLIQIAQERTLEFPVSLLVSRGESLETSCVCLKSHESC